MNIMFFCITFLMGSFSNDNPQLTIHIKNIEVYEGSIIIGVFNTDKDFLEEGKEFSKYRIAVKKANETLVIKDLPKGEYAISMYHDKNSDNKINRNFLGIPKEAYAFSNNIRPQFSAPSYQDCKFSLMENTDLDIVLLN